MATKLKSVLINHYQQHRNRWLLFLKASFFGLALASGSNLLLVLLAGWIYFRPFFEPKPVTAAFLVLLPTAIIGTEILRGSLLFWPGILLYSLIFYLLVGIKEYLFVKRSRLYYVAAMLIFYSIFIEFFLADKSEWFLLKYGLAIFAAFLLFREWLRIISVFSFPKREFLVSAVAALLVGQILWAAALLPIGFVSSANLAFLFVFLLADLLLKHFTGGLFKEVLIQYLVFFFLLAGLIFWTSNWSLGL